MTKEPFLSIVMPVYNTQDYLREAAASVTAQTYPNFELILVDDCSPDSSPAICDELAAADSRIRVLHKPKNEGLSAARNSGIDEAAGDYISFMDSDDTVDSTQLADVAASLIENPSQSVMFGMTEEYYNESGVLRETFIVSYPAKVLKDQIKLRGEVIYIENSTLYGYSANKFYDLKYIKQKNLRFQKITLIEDIRFNVDFFMDAASLNILGTTPYHYKKRGKGSLTDRFVPDYFELHAGRVQLMKDQYLYWKLYTPEVQQILGNIYCRYIFSALQRNFDKRSGMDNKERKAWVRNLFSADLYKETVPAAKPDSRMFKLLVRFLQSKNVFLILFCSRTIYVVKTKLPMLFAKAKQKR